MFYKLWWLPLGTRGMAIPFQVGGERGFPLKYRDVLGTIQSQKSWFWAWGVSEGNHNFSLCSRPGDTEGASSGQVPELHECKITFESFFIKVSLLTSPSPIIAVPCSPNLSTMNFPIKVDSLEQDHIRGTVNSILRHIGITGGRFKECWWPGPSLRFWFTCGCVTWSLIGFKAFQILMHCQGWKLSSGPGWHQLHKVFLHHSWYPAVGLQLQRTLGLQLSYGRSCDGQYRCLFPPRTMSSWKTRAVSLHLLLYV